MVKRMLIDATHPEETRVVVVSGTRLEELDVETSTKKQLKGNIYLAKVVRVEPSLQAAFVDYGGNRHGFLAFSEIHPDYYQIPVADRQALLAEQRASSEAASEGGNGPGGGDDGEPGESVDVVGGDDVEDVERRRPRSTRHYKIQEVIKRRQILLVQVVKEERGNKGAALTTYLSLAGRYCVLMPNTARGGGVSRKIVSVQDRKRLKSIVSELEIPESMAVIVRTAGSERSKAEIKRDYDYLLRMWDSVRELTLKSTAPALVYEEANLIKRAIRDLYARDIDEVHVEGEDGYRAAKDFMRMLTPSHAKKVQPYRDPNMPLFYRHQVESQLDAMHSPIVQLKSGGYIVISPTEALVSIDVNSGRSTKERHIEETALKTNLEAADEIARQLRLRDLAGLIVIDFIDMEESRNNHSVERRLKEAMKNDRARIQLGRISPFGLLELSRQRLRPSLIETSFQPCTHCGGTGQVRSVESTAVYVLRAVEEEGIRRRSSEVTVTVPTPVALYILNQKRAALAEIETRYEFRVFVNGDDTLIPPNYRMDRVKSERPEGRIEEAPRPVEQLAPVAVDDEDEEEEEADETAEAAEETVAETRGEGMGDESQRRKRRRRKRRRRDGEVAPGTIQTAEGGEAAGEEAEEAAEAEAGEADEAGEAGETGETAEAAGEHAGANGERKRRRGKRGGRRRRREGEQAAAMTAEPHAEAAEGEAELPAAIEAAPEAAEAPAEAPAAVETAEPAAAGSEAAETEPKRKPARRRGGKTAAAQAPAGAEAVTEAVADAEPAAEPAKPARSRKKAAPKAEAEKAEKTEKAPAKSRSKAKAKAEPADKPKAEKPAKEKKPARPRKAKSEAAAAVAALAAVEPEAEPAAAVSAAEPSPEPAPQPAPQPAPGPAPEAQAGSDTDGEQSPDAQVVTTLPSDAAPRRGWWRR